MAEDAIFKGEIHVVERDIEQLCDVVHREMVCAVFSLVKGVVDGFFDRHGCVQGHNVQAVRVW